MSAPDPAPAEERQALALVFEALLAMPAEFWLDPNDPRQYSGELTDENSGPARDKEKEK